MTTSPSEVTSEKILDWIKAQVEAKRQLNPDLWINAALRLVVLLGDEADKLVDMRQVVAKIKLKFMEEQEKRNVSEAEIKTAATDEYSAMKKQEYLVNQIEEFIRVAKINAHTMGA